jgi:hypothetical protein
VLASCRARHAMSDATSPADAARRAR